MVYFRVMALLKVSGLTRYEKGIAVADNISFEQQPRQKIAIAGETGSGKTTLLKMISGLLQPDAGKIKFKGKHVPGPYEQLIPGHPDIAYLSQHFELRNNYRVHEILEMANRLTNEEAGDVYAVCRIEHLLGRRTDELSGGERQRIALARLLTGAPQLLLLDEPFSNLDAVHKNIIRAVLYDLGEKLKITCILVSHDAQDLLSWADVILVMKSGKIIQQGTPELLYCKPVNEYCAGLFGDYNLVDASVFFSVPGIEFNGKQLLIRPEKINISDSNINSVNGKVERVLFHGSYYQVFITAGGQPIIAKTSRNGLMPGDKVFVSPDIDSLWYI
jgi:ABC-type sugar transport system ATPase subunit